MLPPNSQQIPMPPTVHQSPTLEGLPKQFVDALRTLFDILDEKQVGFVKLTDIEHRWQDDGTKGLPKGVIESLRKVTPPNGLLSFERFCAGLKICLLRNQVESKKRLGHSGGEGIEPSVRPPSAPLLDMDQKPAVNHWGPAVGRHSNPPIAPQQRTLSMPQLPPAEPTLGIPVKPPLYGPPKPPRTAVGLDRGMDKSEIRSALQNWQLGMMLEEEKRSPGYPGQNQRPRSIGDGKPAVVEPQGHKKPNARRREPRRHTLQNGIDYNMLKRMKQIELEKDVLMQGLEAVDRARDWYLKQISAVQDKMKYLGRMGHSEQWSEAQEERLELQRARVLEVNRHLATLTDPGERGGLPLHMNLAVTPHSSQFISKLKQQNHLLTQDVNNKSDRIKALEREKASLIRELFHIRGQGRPGAPPQEPNAFL
ncbi:suppressor APC domain-containing protein 2 [Cimex lectularius]|uniref:Suppressor APC domain-containing protein n=1 Tax=Cimex lectularius TaxID=79782 RepID=A0A8I6RKC0_CIMLE|nr:suppressor APC domain-containing protein 2 [Cimex lectularius]